MSSSQDKSISRREFMANTTATVTGAVAAASLASCKSLQSVPSTHGKIIGANDRINMAIIGIRSRGNADASGFAKIKGVRIKTICDIDENLWESRAKGLEAIQHSKPGAEYDMRRVFDDKDIDAVIIATPNHWHALATIWACQAGKHVYVEKPCAHNIWEGRKMVEAARKHNCMVQVGFQNRSIAGVRQAMKFLHDGGIGEVYMARGLCYKPRGPIGKCPDGINPNYVYYVWGKKGPCYDEAYMSRVHYDIWQGPAPRRPFNYNRFHYNWHWNWAYGNGDIGNQGPHQHDIARWGMGKVREHPVKITSSGGYYVYKNQAQQTPNTQVATYQYADGKIIEFEVRGLPTNADDEIRIGNLFYGSKGWMHLNGNSWKTYFGHKNTPGPSSENHGPVADPMNLAGSGSDGHYRNFISALRSGNRNNLHCDIETGYYSTALPLLANISYRLGRELVFDGAEEEFEHNHEANEMLTRKYTKPFVVPKNV